MTDPANSGDRALGEDRALRGIVIANAATLIVAVFQEWSVLQLMWPFWMQNLVIGWYARRRILALESYSTEGMRLNGRPVPRTDESLRRVGNFFALHYGLFHAVYLFFLIALTLTTDAGGFIEVRNETTGVTSAVFIGHVQPFDFLVFLGLAWGFARAHRASHIEHVAADVANAPNLGTLMMLPYARVLPMHLSLILAAAMGGGALWLFALLKVAAEIAMHKYEHRALRRAGVSTGCSAGVAESASRTPPSARS